MLGIGGCANVSTVPQAASHAMTSEAGYIVSVPPGETVEIVLPALCLDYSKDIPKRTAQFVSLPQKAPPEVQRLLDLYEQMVAQQDTYKRHLQQISALKILTVEEHHIITPSGARATIKAPFKESLHDALQHAIWQNDPAYINSKYIETVNKELQDAKRTLDDLKAGGNGIGLPPEQQQMIRLLKESGAWDSMKGEFFQKVELMLATKELTMERSKAIKALGNIMRQAVETDDKIKQKHNLGGL